MVHTCYSMMKILHSFVKNLQISLKFSHYLGNSFKIAPTVSQHSNLPFWRLARKSAKIRDLKCNVRLHSSPKSPLSTENSNFDEHCRIFGKDAKCCLAILDFDPDVQFTLTCHDFVKAVEFSRIFSHFASDVEFLSELSESDSDLGF